MYAFDPVLPPSQSNYTPVAPTGVDRHSYFFLQHPLYCSDWLYLNGSDSDCVALGSYKEGFTNKLQVVHGVSYGSESTRLPDGYEDQHVTELSKSVEGFDFHRVAEASVEYPITHLQWDPAMGKSSGHDQRLAASSEVLRLYRVDHDHVDHNNDHKLVQTHVLANNLTATRPDDASTFPPVTAFDWNQQDPNVIITSSVDTTCTVWDLNRSYVAGDKHDTAQVKTQLIAHDLEVFDVKFLHGSTNIFASVGNDGLMRVFDLRSLEHSTIIHEPASPPPSAMGRAAPANYNSTALLKLTTSNVDQHYLATIGVNSNQIIVIDMRRPGIPVVTLDGLLGGVNLAAINLIRFHPSSNYLLSGGDDCQALVWNGLQGEKTSYKGDGPAVVDTPVLAYEEDLEVNNVCWRGAGDWMGVVSGKGFQAVLL